MLLLSLLLFSAVRSSAAREEASRARWADPAFGRLLRQDEESPRAMRPPAIRGSCSRRTESCDAKVQSELLKSLVAYIRVKFKPLPAKQPYK